MISLTLYVPCIVNNYINKPTRCTFCMYLFYNFCTTLHVSNDHFVLHPEFINLRTPDDERNGRSKHVELYKNCRINTYRKCMLLVCLYNKRSHFRFSNIYRNFLLKLGTTKHILLIRHTISGTDVMLKCAFPVTNVYHIGYVIK